MTNKEMYLNTINEMTSSLLSDFNASQQDEPEAMHRYIDLVGSITGLFNEVETLKKAVEELETKLNKIEFNKIGS